jgi:hypothetical protein
MKLSDHLPDDEGFVFMAWSPKSNFMISGRRGRDGELYAGSIRFPHGGAPTLEDAKNFIAGAKRDTGVNIELVTGAEADKLFSQMALHLALSGADQRVKQ